MPEAQKLTKSGMNKMEKGLPLDEDDFYPEEEEEIVEGNGSEFTNKNMRRAEEEVSQRQMVEYREKLQPTPESSVEMDAKLLNISAKMAVKKELMPAKDQAGIVRNIAIELEEEYPEPFTEDIIKGNFGDSEQGNVFGHITLINAMKTIGQAKNFNFVNACRFNKSQMDAIANISRAKGGFSAILMKTDKHVSEGVVQHVQRQFQETRKKRWGVF